MGSGNSRLDIGWDLDIVGRLSPSRLACFEGQRPSGAEPGELSQWPRHDDSSVNIDTGIITTSRGGVQSIAMSVSVCLSVCLFAYLKDHTFKFHEIFCTRQLWPWLRLRLTSVQCVMCFRFCG